MVTNFASSLLRRSLYNWQLANTDFSGTKSFASPCTTHQITTSSRFPYFTTTKRRISSERHGSTSGTSSYPVEARTTSGAILRSRASTLARCAWRSHTMTSDRNPRSQLRSLSQSRQSRPRTMAVPFPESRSSDDRCHLIPSRVKPPPVQPRIWRQPRLEPEVPEGPKK